MKRDRKSRSKKALRDLNRENLKAIESVDTMKHSKVTCTNTYDYAGSHRRSAFEMFSDSSADRIEIKPSKAQPESDQLFKVEIKPKKS